MMKVNSNQEQENSTKAGRIKAPKKPQNFKDFYLQSWQIWMLTSKSPSDGGEIEPKNKKP